MNASVIAAVIAALATLVVGAFTARQAQLAASNTAKIERTKVDAAAYQQAMAYYEQRARRTDEDIDRLRHEVVHLREELVDEERESRKLRRRIEHLEARVRALRRLLVAHDIPVPPHLAADDELGNGD